ncbi:hypothetical protein ABZ806_17815 [Spirillospora sp. NPDC047418]|jgi:hypothetical protein
MTQATFWRWPGALAPALTGLAILGFWAMSALQARADRARELDCLHHRAAAHWSHGYGAWLPVGVFASTALAAVLAVAVLAAGARSPQWARVLCAPILLIALCALVPAGLAAEAYFVFPGADVSTVSAAPCGVG